MKRVFHTGLAVAVIGLCAFQAHADNLWLTFEGVWSGEIWESVIFPNDALVAQSVTGPGETHETFEYQGQLMIALCIDEIEHGEDGSIEFWEFWGEISGVNGAIYDHLGADPVTSIDWDSTESSIHGEVGTDTSTGDFWAHGGGFFEAMLADLNDPTANDIHGNHFLDYTFGIEGGLHSVPIQPNAFVSEEENEFWASESYTSLWDEGGILFQTMINATFHGALVDAQIHSDVVPEPATMSLLGLGLLGLVARRKAAK